MGEETYVCSVSRDPSKVLDDHCGPRTDCLPQLYAAVEPMHSAAQELACRNVCLRGWSHIVSDKFDIQRRSLDHCQQLPSLAAEARAKAEGAVMLGAVIESDCRQIGACPG